MTELQEKIERILPENWAFETYTRNVKGTIFCELKIFYRGELKEQKQEDSLYWAMQFIINYFENLN